MKRFFFALCALILVFFSSCVFSIDDDSGSDEYATGRTETVASPTVEVTRYYTSNNTLLRYDERYVKSGTENGSRLIAQAQTYSASGALLSVVAYTYTATDALSTAAFYDANAALNYVEVYDYDSEGEPVSLTIYGADGQIQRSRLWSSQDFTTGTGSMEITALFSQAENAAAGTLELDSTVARYYLPSSGHWNMEASWGTTTGFETPDTAAITAMAPTADTVENHGISSLTALPSRSGTVPSAPSAEELWSSGLDLASTRYYYEDSDGNSLVTLDENWRPLWIVRDDDRFDKAVSVELSYNDDGLIASKQTWYGSTLALKVDVLYDSAHFPVSVSTSGAVMAMPLSFSISYGSDHSFQEIDVASNDVVLQKFTFSYSAATVPMIRDNLASFDLFAFADDLLASETTIKNYNGDDELLQSIVFAATGTGYRASVYKGEVADNILNGWYDIRYSDGLASSISSVSADGAEVWAREFGYGKTFFSDLGSAIEGTAASKVANLETGLGRLSETWIPAAARGLTAGATLDGDAFFDSLSKDALFDLVFDLLF